MSFMYSCLPQLQKRLAPEIFCLQMWLETKSPNRILRRITGYHASLVCRHILTHGSLMALPSPVVLTSVVVLYRVLFCVFFGHRFYPKTVSVAVTC